MKKAIIISVIVLTVLLTLSVVAVVYFTGGEAEQSAKPQKEILSAEEYFSRGMKYISNGDFKRALSVLKSAVRLETDNAAYHWELAKLAKAFDKKTLVRRHGESAWEIGLNNTQVFFFLLDTHEGSEGYLYRKGLALLKKVDDEQLKKELLGDLQIRTGDPRKGITTLESVYGETGEGRVALKLARILLLNGEKEKALAFLGDLRSRGRLDTDLFNLYVTAVIVNDDYKTADELFDEAAGKEWFDDPLKLKRAVFKIAKGEFGAARGILEEMNGRIAGKAEESVYNPRGMTVRKYLAFLYSLDNNREKIGELTRQSLEESARFGGGAGAEPSSTGQADNKLLEGEQLLYSYLRESEKERSYDLIRNCRLLLPSEPVSNFFFIRHCMFNGRFEEGLELFRNIRNDRPGECLAGVEGIFYRNPVFLINVAEAFAANKRTDTALYLVSWVHERGIYSKQSIRLFRDLTYSKQRPGLSREAQKMLEEVYSDDDTVAFQGAVLDMNTGNLDDSLKSLNSLLERRPGSEPVKIARVTVLMRQGKYDEALKECDTLKAPADNICILRARIYAEMKEEAKAEECYRKSITINDKPVAKLEYANFLLSLGKEDDAAAIYHSILNEKPEEPSALIGLATIHINGGDPAGARDCLKRVMAVNDKIEYLYILSAKIDLFESKAEEAILKCEMALAINPDNVYAKFLSAQAEMMIAMSRENPTNRRVKLLEAEKKLDACAAILPGNLQIMTAKLIARVNLGRYEDALDIVEGLLEDNKGNLLFTKTRIELLAALKKEDLVAGAFEDLRKITTEEDSILFEASFLVSQNKRKEALQKLKGRLDSPEIALRWALLRLLSGEGSDGILDRISRFDYDGAQWFAVGVAAEEKSDFPFARECYRKAMEKNTEAPEILNNFAWCSIQLEEYDEEKVLAAAESAYKLLPGAMEVLDTYAAVMIACGKQAECISLMLERDGMVKKNPALLYRLAAAYEKSGDADAAAGVYRSLLTFSDSELPEGVRRAEIERKIGAGGSCD